MKMEVLPQCAKCPGGYCRVSSPEQLNKEVLPQACPMRNSPDLIQEMIQRYSADEVKSIYVPATITEKEAYETIRGVRMSVRPRIKEIVEYYKLIDAKRIGVAFCAGLRDEARLAVDFLERNGLTVASVMCKCGGVDKTKLHIENRYKIGDPSKFEAACNPLTQAELLNRADTDFNVIIGLCVGHDMLFTSNSRTPVTTLIVKDRMLGHNPLAALYSGYHRAILESQRRT
jgi:uncharacterized metal-binding protein